MKNKKIIIIFIAIIGVTLINFFNSAISSYILNQKKSTNLQLRKNYSSICKALMSFEIKNIDVIIIGDSHSYAGINLELLNKNFENLVLACATPTISINNLTNLSEKIYKKYEPKLMIIGLSAFQFIQADEEKEKERDYYYNFAMQNERYRFHFDVIKQYVLHFIKPFSETDIANKQTKFLDQIKKNKPDFYEDEKNKNINSTIINRYNKYLMNKKDNEKQIDRICKKFNNIKDKIFFIDLPTPNFFKDNLKYNNLYRDSLQKLSQCFQVFKSENINELSKDIYFYDRGAFFLKKKNLKFDVSHMNFAGSLIYTNYLINLISNYNIE